MNIQWCRSLYVFLPNISVWQAVSTLRRKTMFFECETQFTSIKCETRFIRVSHSINWFHIWYNRFQIEKPGFSSYCWNGLPYKCHVWIFWCMYCQEKMMFSFYHQCTICILCLTSEWICIILMSALIVCKVHLCCVQTLLCMERPSWQIVLQSYSCFILLLKIVYYYKVLITLLSKSKYLQRKI